MHQIQPYTRAFNDFLYEFFNLGKFVKIRNFFAEVTNSRSMHTIASSMATVRDDINATSGTYRGLNIIQARRRIHGGWGLANITFREYPVQQSPAI